jgi:uncharacterized protein YjbI with pentapeptide repeats
MFKEVKFLDCKLTGLHFDHCDAFLFAVDFDNCLLQLSSFYRLKMRKTNFLRTDLREADFTEADLTGALFEETDLQNAVFDQTILEKANFTKAFNYSINPDNNRIKNALFSYPGVLGLLNKYQITIA